jgi:hypothetical protein
MAPDKERPGHPAAPRPHQVDLAASEAVFIVLAFADGDPGWWP